ncbi:hypothetical protein KI372_10280, partial [Halobacterium salinarum]|nr:hypothetical protein [Halobacterium salinarum]
MSTPSQSSPTGAVPTPASATLLKPLEVAGFWLAVALPFIYLPLIIMGPQSVPVQTALAALIGVHAATLLVGHR